MKLKASKKSIKQLGAGAIEYGLVLAAVVTIVMAAATSMEDEIDNTFSTAALAIEAFATEGTTNNTTNSN